MTDDALIRLAKAGDLDAMETLVLRYRGIAYAISRSFYFEGAEWDDVKQEALIAVTGAVRTYQEGHIPFEAFVGFCVRRWLSSALLASQRQKHRILNESRRRATAEDGDSFALAERLPDPNSDPADIIIRREGLRELIARMDDLSPIERMAVVGIANGLSYNEIGECVGGRRRADNALQRARKKLAA